MDKVVCSVVVFCFPLSRSSKLSSSYLFFLGLDMCYDQDFQTPIRLNQGEHTGACTLWGKPPHFPQRAPMDPSDSNSKPVNHYSIQKDICRVTTLIPVYGVSSQVLQSIDSTSLIDKEHANFPITPQTSLACTQATWARLQPVSTLESCQLHDGPSQISTPKWASLHFSFMTTL